MADTRIVNFTGFGDEAFEFFERVQSLRSWAEVQLLRDDWDQAVHAPMEALLDQLGPEFGRDAYAYNLHRDPYLWLHQVGVITVADTIGYRLVLSVTGMVASGGWLRSAADQVQRYRETVASTAGQQAQALLATARDHGLSIQGQRLSRSPRGWPADHPRVDLLRYRTLFACEEIPATSLASGPACVQAVTASLRRMHPLTSWLAEHVGPRRKH